MSAAFIVLAHGHKNLLLELLKELQPYPTFLHFDRGAGKPGHEIENFMLEHDHVTINDDPRCVHWGGFSALVAMINTLDLALKSTDTETNHFVFLSGQCFPLRPVSEFVKMLSEDPNTVLCRARALNGKKEMGLNRVKRRHWLDGAVGHLKKTTGGWVGGLARRVLMLVSSPFRVNVPNVIHACGSQWVAIPRLLAIEIVNHYNSGHFDYLRNSFAPDEVAIPTFVYNSKWMRHTPARNLERSPSRKVGSLPNFHWLLPSMDGCVDAADVGRALDSRAYFVRKMPGTDFADLIQRIKSTWT